MPKSLVGSEELAPASPWRPLSFGPFFGRALQAQVLNWLLPAALVAAWQAASALGFLSDAVLPSPAAVLAAGWQMTLTENCRTIWR